MNRDHLKEDIIILNGGTPVNVRQKMLREERERKERERQRTLGSAPSTVTTLSVLKGSQKDRQIQLEEERKYQEYKRQLEIKRNMDHRNQLEKVFKGGHFSVADYIENKRIQELIEKAESLLETSNLAIQNSQQQIQEYIAVIGRGMSMFSRIRA